MNHDQITLELLVRSGSLKATERLIKSSSVENSEAKLVEARIYWHMYDMWESKSKKTNANFGVLPDRAREFHDDEGVREYFNATTNASLVRDFLALAIHAVSVSGTTIGGSDTLGSLTLLDDESILAAISRTRDQYHIGEGVHRLVHCVEYRLQNLREDSGEDIPTPEVISPLRQCAQEDGEPFQKKDPSIVDSYDPLPELPIGTLSERISRFEKLHGRLSDRIFTGEYSPEEQRYLAQKIAYWFGSNNGDCFGTFYRYEQTHANEPERAYDKVAFARHMGNAVELELTHGYFKRVSFLLQLPEHVVDRSNQDIAGFATAYDLITLTGEREHEPGGKMFMLACG